MSIKTSLSVDGSAINLVLSGAFDISRSLQLRDVINTLPATVRIIRIDLQQVTSIDASIFSTLLLLYFEKDSNVNIEVINCSKALAQRLSLAGLDRLIAIRMSSEQAGYELGDAEEKDQSKDHQ